ncbi:AbiH family protein [Halobacillus amylolyticus]|uniref:SIR2-like domain-containing protein n=1 Tax=Halobacillus amylolyticus TaxID=2932259 RepID=A0ABY4HB25_9BACI|nr:AbiH family protein [Halobacillus amylolyticus]UOR12101.1 hypothetical protein MUO15_00715 [Halobacillus amylolyticus]
MRKRRICVLAGNGLTIDLIKHLALDIDPASPLKSFHSPDIDFSSFIHQLRSIEDELLPLSQNQSDFDAMNQFLNYGNWDNGSKESDLRKFLALSYSTLQLEIDKYKLFDWSWMKWMKKYRKDIVGFVSFNYDLILEKTFRFADPSRGYFRMGTNNERGGVPFFKPHGSIDFELPIGIGFGDEDSAWSSSLTGNQVLDENGNGYITSIPYDDVTQYRKQPDIIPPTQENYHEKMSWVQGLFKNYSDFTKYFDVNTFVIVGHSCADVDRKEINYFIRQLPRGCSFYIVNPSYESNLIKELVSFIESEGHKVKKLIKYGPPSL